MNQRIGILGGGQLGKMLYSAGSQLDMDLHFLDGQPDCPVAKVAPSVQVGGLKDPKAILVFGADKDILTIEIEKVNTAVLEELRQSGKKVFPQPHIIELIQDKGRQKEFYASNDIPSSDFALYHSREAARSEVSSGRWTYPFVQKMRTDGYDGRGVHMIRSEADWDDAFPNNFLIEAAVDIKKELAVVTCTDTQGHTICYDPVEMVFHPEANLLLYQLAPADVSESIRTSAQKLAKDVARKYGVVGLLAVELFVDQEDQLLVNEVAPRPHNSGHHTIEACYTSQYENHLR
ncbi:MAG: ATP-grasp domain-containing protein, partial [Bacteroidota bacterium]